uniref:hypothetical protein n=1 Tax=Escherichia coli TaxID=562 RepID=UPI001F26FE50
MHSTLFLIITCLAASTSASLADYLSGSRTLGDTPAHRPATSGDNRGSDERRIFGTNNNPSLTFPESSGRGSSTDNTRNEESVFGTQGIRISGSSDALRISPGVGVAQVPSGSTLAADTSAPTFGQGSSRARQAGSGPAPVRRVESLITPTVTKVV